MNEIPNSCSSSSSTMDFVALDIRNIATIADYDPSPRLITSLTRKGSQRTEGDAIVNGGPQGSEKSEAVPVHVAAIEESASPSHGTTPTGSGWKYRRVGSRRVTSSPWLDPRRVLFVFAALSSMGTLILLYFTLSMGKMSSGGADADAQ